MTTRLKILEETLNILAERDYQDEVILTAMYDNVIGEYYSKGEWIENWKRIVLDEAEDNLECPHHITHMGSCAGCGESVHD